MKGLSKKRSDQARVKVASRLARKYYGTDCSAEYDSSIHPLNKRYGSILRETERVY